jgi:cysteine desulfurase
MLPWFTERCGNASSRTHAYGLEARAATERARGQIASLIGGDPRELVLTSGATEADNLAILGVARAFAAPGHLITSAIEHSAVLDPARALEAEGWAVTRIAPDSEGRVPAAAVLDALRPDTRLVSLMLANNEVGTLQPVAEVAAACSARGVFTHTDAAQAVGHVPVNARALGVDLLTLTAHKLYGPKGVGALWVRAGRPKVPVVPIQFGGGQERGLRPGTTPVPLVVGFGEACALAEAALAQGAPAAIAARRDRMWRGLQEQVDRVVLNGPERDRLPHNLNFSVQGVESEALLMGVRHAIACSSGAACSSATLEPSRVLRAMGLDDARLHGSIRIGLGRATTDAEIATAVEVFARVVRDLRAMDALLGVGDLGEPSGRD